MTDYIRRDTLIEDIDESVKHRGMGEIIGQTLRRYILRQPAADVAEVVPAQWEEADWREYDAQSCETIRYPKAAIVCTNCRCAFKKGALWSRKFCPNCGARMDGWMEDADNG